MKPWQLFKRERSAMSWPAGCLMGVAGAVSVASMDASAGMCTARSAVYATPVVELYTSEGCSSCPPADKWLSSLKGRNDVVALAYHVDYWDRLGWKDRFASPAYTQRQYEQQALNGARFAYTPQVVIEGRDRKDWPRAAVGAEHAPAPVSIELTRETGASGDTISATVTVVGNAPPRIAAYWAVTESGHRTAVKSGENEGATLNHDFVVRDHEAVPAWVATKAEAKTLTHSVRLPADPAHGRRVNLVVVDAATGRPLQALGVDCS
jgi:hypothetical protein